MLALVLTSRLCNQGKQPHSRKLNLFLHMYFMLLKKNAVQKKKKGKQMNSSLKKKIVVPLLFFKSQYEMEHASCSKVGLVAGGSSSGPTSCAIR